MSYFDPLSFAIFGLLAEMISSEFTKYIVSASILYFTLRFATARYTDTRKVRNKDPNKGQIRSEILRSIRTTVIFSIVSLSVVYGIQNNLTQIYRNIDEMGVPYLVGSTVFVIVLHDAWFYWTHRLIHNPRLFRAFHITHHKSHRPTPFTAYSFDIGEAVLNGLYVPILVFVLPLHPIVLGVFTIHMIIRNVMGHSGVELFPSNSKGQPFFDWMTTVTHHDMHHELAFYNFGLYFTWWDRWMGTEHPDYHARFAKSVRYAAPPQKAEVDKGCPYAKAHWLKYALIVCFTSVLTFSSNIAEASQVQNIKGRWVTEGYGAIVDIDACKQNPDNLCGTITWLWNETAFDHKVIGTEMLWDFKLKDLIWQDGRIRIPGENNVYSSKIEPVSHSVIKVSGCALGIICQSQIWRRLESLPHQGMIAEPDSFAHGGL